MTSDNNIKSTVNFIASVKKLFFFNLVAIFTSCIKTVQCICSLEAVYDSHYTHFLTYVFFWLVLLLTLKCYVKKWLKKGENRWNKLLF